MIQIHINPARVEKILFVVGSDIEEDFDRAAWQVIRPLVHQIDERLSRVIGQIAGKGQAGNQPEPER